MKRNKQEILVVVFTPLQYLNVLKYLSDNDVKYYKVLILSSDGANVNQFNKLIKQKELIVFKNIIYLPFLIRWIIVSIYVKYYINVDSYERIIIGNYNNIFAYFLGHKFSLKGKEVILIDDGFATIDVFNRRNLKGELSLNYADGHFNNYLRSTLKIDKNSKINQINFYTVFYKKLYKISKHDILSENKLIPQKINEKTINKGLCYFIGAPLVEKGILKENLYFEITNKIINYFQSQSYKVEYIKHRFELGKKNSAETIDLGIPIEVYFSEKKSNYPLNICSYYSTALFNLAILYPMLNFYYYDISDEVSLEFREILNKVYDNMSDVGNIKKIDFL